MYLSLAGEESFAQDKLGPLQGAAFGEIALMRDQDVTDVIGMIQEGHPLWPVFVHDYIAILSGQAGQQTNGVTAKGQHLPTGQF